MQNIKFKNTKVNPEMEVCGEEGSRKQNGLRERKWAVMTVWRGTTLGENQRRKCEKEISQKAVEEIKRNCPNVDDKFDPRKSKHQDLNSQTS